MAGALVGGEGGQRRPAGWRPGWSTPGVGALLDRLADDPHPQVREAVEAVREGWSETPACPYVQLWATSTTRRSESCSTRNGSRARMPTPIWVSPSKLPAKRVSRKVR